MPGMRAWAELALLLSVVLQVGYLLLEMGRRPQNARRYEPGLWTSLKAWTVQSVETTSVGFRQQSWRTDVPRRALSEAEVGDCTKHPGEGCATNGSLCGSTALHTLSLDRLVVGKSITGAWSTA